VKEFDWEDHHSPNLDLLFRACQIIDEFLQKNPENVIVIHCNAGKGRTGTLISCYLRYSGRFEQSIEVMEYYKKKRFEKGGGVTQPSQMRYVDYFTTILNSHLNNEPRFHPCLVQIDKLVMYGMPKNSFTGYIKPFVEIYDVRDRKMRQTTRIPNEDPPKFLRKFVGEDIIPVDLSSKTIMSGDILVRVYDLGYLGAKVMCRFGFNTAFLQKNVEDKVVLNLKIEDLDPDSLKKDDHFPENFRVELHMTVLPDSVDPQNPNANLLSNLLEREKKDWEEIYRILENYKPPSKEEAQSRLFKSPERDDVNLILNNKNPFSELSLSQEKKRTESN